MNRRLTYALFFAFFAACAPARAQTPDPSQLDELTRQQEDAERRDAELAKNQTAVRTEIGRLEKNLLSIAANMDGLEQQSASLDLRLNVLKEKETRLRAAIYSDRQALSRLLGALIKVETNPPPALAIRPEDAADAVRAARLMSGISSDLTVRANELGQQLEELERVREDIGAEQARLAETEQNLAAQRDQVKSLVAEKSKLEASISEDRAAVQAQAKALAADADTLRELIRTLEQNAAGISPRLKPSPSGRGLAAIDVTPRLKPDRRAPPAPLTLPPDTQRFADARGALRAPVTGSVTAGYSAINSGFKVRTRSGAQVVAPFGGRVEFAGPFKNYDNVVILNMGDEYFLLLTGLGETYPEIGSMVTAGEPVGLMPFNAQNAAELYIEIRKNGATIDPTPWLGTAFARG